MDSWTDVSAGVDPLRQEHKGTVKRLSASQTLTGFQWLLHSVVSIPSIFFSCGFLTTKSCCGRGFQSRDILLLQALSDSWATLLEWTYKAKPTTLRQWNTYGRYSTRDPVVLLLLWMLRNKQRTQRNERRHWISSKFSHTIFFSLNSSRSTSTFNITWM